MSRDDRPYHPHDPPLPAATALLPTQHDPYYDPPRPPQHHHHHHHHQTPLHASLAPLSSHFRDPPPSSPRHFPASDPLPPTPTPTSAPRSFSDLTTGILHHPFFTLLLKRAFECIGAPLEDVAPPHPLLDDADARARALHEFAEAHGLDRACARWTSTDVFLAAAVAALSSAHAAAAAAAAAAVPSTEPPASLQYVLATATRAVGEGWQADSPRGRQHMPRDRLIQKPAAGGASRTPLSDKAKLRLEQWFMDNLKNPYPTGGQKQELARMCGMSLSSVNNWFGNKRMRIKRKMLNEAVTGEGVFAGEAAASISDKVLAPRSKWNAVVVSRMNSQAGRNVVKSATGRTRGYGEEQEYSGRMEMGLRGDSGAHQHVMGYHHEHRMPPPGGGRPPFDHFP